VYDSVISLQGNTAMLQFPLLMSIVPTLLNLQLPGLLECRERE